MFLLGFWFVLFFCMHDIPVYDEVSPHQVLLQKVKQFRIFKKCLDKQLKILTFAVTVNRAFQQFYWTLWVMMNYH